MKIIDELTREEIFNPDLTNGRLEKAVVVKADAEPIDNVKKFSYGSEDFETVQIYHALTEEEKNPKPSIEEQTKMNSAAIVSIMKEMQRRR